MKKIHVDDTEVCEPEILIEPFALQEWIRQLELLKPIRSLRYHLGNHLKFQNILWAPFQQAV